MGSPSPLAPVARAGPIPLPFIHWSLNTGLAGGQETGAGTRDVRLEAYDYEYIGEIGTVDGSDPPAQPPSSPPSILGLPGSTRVNV